MNDSKWTKTSLALPERNSRVVWISPSGDEVRGTYMGVWMLDNGMYVYYEPSYWRYDKENVDGK